MKALAWKSLWERWSEWLRKEEKKNVVNNGEKPTRTTQRLKSFLNRRFDFRYNRLTGVTEYREKEAVGTPFRPIDEREMNGLIVDARLAGIPCWNSLIPTLVLSNKVESFNPFHLYLSELPEGNEEGRWMTAAEMSRVMLKHNPTTLRGITTKQLSHRLSGWNFKYKHTNHGNYYLAVCQQLALQLSDNQQ